MSSDRYPYTHHGPPVHGSKLLDYLISEMHLRKDRPELFEACGGSDEPAQVQRVSETGLE